jgi:hypothetical protein
MVIVNKEIFMQRNSKTLKKIYFLIQKYYFPLIIIAFFAYSAIVIYKTSYVLYGIRFFSLSDDEMTGMRYAYNLAHGYGLLFNPHAQPVEGITNPLWVIFMAIWHLLPIPIEKISVFIQISGAILTAAALYFIKKIAELISKSTLLVVIPSILLSAFYFPLINWNLVQGTEVSILMFVLSWAAYLTLKSARDKKFSPLLFIVLGVGTLIRMDFLLSGIIIIAFLFFVDRKNRLKNVFVGFAMILAFLAGQEILRILYYHEILPNTYYQKMTGFPILKRLTRGLYFGIKSFSPEIGAAENSQIIQFFERLFIFFMLIIPFIYSLIKKNKPLMFLLGLFAAQELYSIYVGGDVWEYYGGANRFIAFTMPLFFVSLMMTIYSFRQLLKKYYLRMGNKYKLIEIIIICIIFILINKANRYELPRLFLSMPPTTVDADQVNQSRTKEAYELMQIVKPNARIAVAASGSVPYFVHNYFCDILGKNDNTIAHMQAILDPKSLNIFNIKAYTSYQPGHIKWDNVYLTNNCKPDIYSEFWQAPYDKSDQYVLSHGYVKMKSADGLFPYYVLKNSPNLKFEKLIPQ